MSGNFNPPEDLENSASASFQEEWKASKPLFTAEEIWEMAKKRAVAICRGQRGCLQLVIAIVFLIYICDATARGSVAFCSEIAKQWLWSKRPTTSEGLWRDTNKALDSQLKESTREDLA